MKSYLKPILGYFCAGFTITFFWSNFTESFGIIGGWLAALLLVGPMWYFNHYHNFVLNMPDAVFIDMGLAVAITNITVTIMGQTCSNMINSLIHALPTLIFLAIGAAIGTYLSIKLKNKIKKVVL